MIKERPFHLSPSAIGTFTDCEARFWFEYLCQSPEIRQLAQLQDYPLILGQELHRHIAQIHKKVRGRPLWFKTKEAAVGAWYNRWKRATEKATEQETLMFSNKPDHFQSRAAGKTCIENYWDFNQAMEPPTEVEKRYSWRLANGLWLVGVLDQIRQVSIGEIKRRRPELITDDGSLADGYGPWVIVDNKTGHLNYDAADRLENPSLEDQARFQAPLHSDPQFTIYTYLFWKAKGVWPVGVMVNELRSGKTYFTWRTPENFQLLDEKIVRLLNRIEGGEFTRDRGAHCRRCPFLRPCWGSEDLRIVPLEILTVRDALTLPIEVQTGIVESRFRQSRLALGVPRTKASGPKGLPPTADPNSLVLPLGTPWGGPDQTRIL